MTRFRNYLTVNERDEQRECNFILFPEGSEKTIITRSGFKALLKCKAPDRDRLRSWATEFPSCIGTTPAHWCDFCTQLEAHCAEHRVYVHPVDETRACSDPQGFSVGDHREGDDVDFPDLCAGKLELCSGMPHKRLHKEGIPPPALASCMRGACGYANLRHIMCRFHPKLVKTPTNHAVPPKQDDQSLNDFTFQCRFCVRMLGHMKNQSHSFAHNIQCVQGC